MGRKKIYETEEELKEHTRKYNREYNYRRYNNDPEFRERKLKNLKNSRKRTNPPKPKLTEEEKKEKSKASVKKYYKENRAKIQARKLYRYHNDPEVNRKAKESTKKWYENRIKNDPEYKEIVRERQRRHTKKWQMKNSQES